MPDDTPLDDRLPHHPEPAPETSAERYRRVKLAEQGLVERNGVRYLAEKDWFTVSGLRATIRELHEHLQVVSGERDQAREELLAMISVQRKTARVAEEALAQVGELRAHNDALLAEVASLRRTNT